MSNTISWLPIADTVEYVISRAPSSGGPWTIIGTIPHDLTGPSYNATTGKFVFVDTEGQSGDYYQLIAKDQYGRESTPSLPENDDVVVGLTTVEALRTFLSLTPTHTADDQLLGRLAEAASTWFENQVGEKILTNTYTEESFGTGGTILVPMHQPATAVASVKVNGQTIPAITNPGEHGFKLINGVIRLVGHQFTANAIVEIVYTAGFVKVPADVEQAVLELAALSYRDRKRLGTGSQAMAGESVSFLPSVIPAKVQSVVENYRMARV